MLERLIGGAAVDNHAKALHLGISTDALLEQIKKDPAFKDANGQFQPWPVAQALQSINMNEQGYLNSLRESNLRRQILTTIGKVGNGPEILINALNRYNGETRTLRFVLVPGSMAGTIPDPTDDDLKRYYENHHTKFTQPEFRKVGVLAVTPETVKDQVTITEADLKAAFEANKDKLGNPEKRHVQQITFPDLAAANAAYQKIQSGTDFVAIAKEQDLSRKRHRPRHGRPAPTSPIRRSPTPPSRSS